MNVLLMVVVFSGAWLALALAVFLPLHADLRRDDERRRIAASLGKPGCDR